MGDELTSELASQAELHLQLLQFAMENASIEIYWLGNDARLYYANSQACKTLGYSKEEFLQLSLADLDPNYSIELWREHWQSLKLNKTVSFESLHKRKNGEVFPVEVVANYVCFNGHEYNVGFAKDITERKRIEHELKESGERFHSLAEAMPQMVWIAGADGRNIYFNQQWVDYTGLTLEESAGHGWNIPFHPDDQQRSWDAWQHATQTDGVYSLECRLRRKDGIYRWWLIRGVSLHDDGGKVIQWYGTCTDIEDIKRGEKLLQQYKVAIETTHEGFWIVDASGILQEVNQAYANMTGFGIDELRGMHISELASVDKSFDDVTASITKVIAQGHDLFEMHHHHKDGRELAFEVSVTFIPESQRFVAFFRDISERKNAEAALRIAAIAFETHEAIVITDADATIIRINRAFEVITGYGTEDVLGKNPRVLSSGRHGEQFYAEMWRQLLEEEAWSGEIWDKRKNGEIYPKWLTITAVKDGAGKVTEYVAIFSDITERKRAEDEIRNLAFFDALTGLPNRRMLQDRLKLALSLSARSHQCGALLFLDMDKFKILNDTQGHDYGDLMLIEVGRRIQACVREADTVARLGGDEFVVLIEEISVDMNEASQKTALVAEKIRMVLAEPYELKWHEFHSSPSIGVTMYCGNTESVDTLMKHADMAMYQAKDSGRNAVRFFDPLMQRAMEARAGLEADLRSALSTRQLQLYYQVQMDSDHRPIGAEALIRWIHPQRGMVPPIQLISIAEESSLILDIGNWVFETACRQLAKWAESPQLQHLKLAVNVSARQFQTENFVERLEKVIAQHGVIPDRLKLELTESMVLEDVADVVAKMRAVKALGVRLSLDDFGTGYASLAYLIKLPLDQIKIDQSFVRDITTNSSHALMVKTIIDMGLNFRLNVIAEGVETGAQLAFLKQHGCMAYQGYLFSMPVPLPDFEALVQSMLG